MLQKESKGGQESIGTSLVWCTMLKKSLGESLKAHVVKHSPENYIKQRTGAFSLLNPLFYTLLKLKPYIFFLIGNILKSVACCHRRSNFNFHQNVVGTLSSTHRKEKYNLWQKPIFLSQKSFYPRQLHEVISVCVSILLNINNLLKIKLEWHMKYLTSFKYCIDYCPDLGARMKYQ